MSSNIAIKVENLSKCYQIYSQPRDRLKQFIFPKVKYFFGLSSSQYFKEFWALKDVSFEIKKGEAVGIIGKNGSGKSTLLQLVCSILNLTSGNISTSGRIAALLELGSGFNPEFTGRENVFMNAALLGLTREETEARYDDIVIFADIGQFIDQPIKTYSSGMVVRLAFAVIAHVDADILIVDEALAVGDAAFSRKCISFLRKFMEKGTVMFVSHDTASIKNLCNRVIWLNNGCLMLDGDPKTVSDAYLKLLYGNQQRVSSVISKPNQVPVMGYKEEKPVMIRDMRQDFLNASNLRNDIKVVEMRSGVTSFGENGVSISRVSLEDDSENTLVWIVGGEEVKLIVEGEANQYLAQLLIGFTIKDRLGQYLFGDNTYLSFMDVPVSVIPGERFFASFKFIMPMLRVGDYSIDVAVVDGSQVDHIMHLWANDVVQLKSVTSSVCTGLIGIPIMDIQLKILS